MARFDIEQLYNTSYGFIAPGWTRRKAIDRIKRAEEYTINSPGETPPPALGLLGAPIMLPCDLDDVRLPNEPLIDIAGEKLIVKTQIDGNSGTFKELYATGDWQVTIRGICVDEENPDDYPEDQVRAIRNIIERQTHVRVVNRLTALFGIEYLAIENYSMPAEEGRIGMQRYELRCLSDKEFPLRLRRR